MQHSSSDPTQRRSCKWSWWLATVWDQGQIRGSDSVPLLKYVKMFIRWINIRETIIYTLKTTKELKISTDSIRIKLLGTTDVKNNRDCLFDHFLSIHSIDWTDFGQYRSKIIIFLSKISLKFNASQPLQSTEYLFLISSRSGSLIASGASGRRQWNLCIQNSGNHGFRLLLNGVRPQLQWIFYVYVNCKLHNLARKQLTSIS